LLTFAENPQYFSGLVSINSDIIQIAAKKSFWQDTYLTLECVTNKKSKKFSVKKHAYFLRI